MNQRSAKNRTGDSQLMPMVTNSLIAIVCYVAAHRVPHGAPLILFYLVSLCRLIDSKLPSQAFYSGLIVGTVSFATELTFFWKIFGIAAVVLWGILGFWIGLFLLIAQQVRITFGNRFLFSSLPLIWLGLEYFRSEGYFLKFSWLAVGAPFVNSPVPLPAFLGSYGTGALLVWLAYATSRMKRIPLLSSTIILLMAFSYLSRTPPSAPLQSVRESPALHIAGIQLEFPSPSQIIRSLDSLVNQHPDVDLIVLSEYSLQSPPTDVIKQWCRAHKKHLIIGGKDPVDDDRYRNTAFVVGPDGKVLFKQAKSEPIQFFDDGEPALKQDLWESPWGSIGIAICYDLSFTRVTDELIRQGAQLLIVPTMDVVDWGRREHQLHSRITPIRSAEYQIPIVRVASSGISQSVDERGQLQCQAPFPGQGEMISSHTVLVEKGRLPWDRQLGPIAVILITLLGIAWVFIQRNGQGSPWRTENEGH